MKAMILSACFIAIVGLAACAQDNSRSWSDEPDSRFYLHLGVGGGIGLCDYDPCDEFDEDYGPTSDVLSSVNFAPGKGFNVDLGFGYRFNRYFSAELDINDHFGLKTKTNVTYESIYDSYTKNTSYRAMVFSLIPSFVITPGLENYNPYARFGLGIGIIPDIYYTEVKTTGSSETSIEGRYHGGVPLGYSIAAGMDFNLTKGLKLFGEFDFTGMNYTPKYYDLTKYTVNGTDILGGLSESQKRTEFVKSYDKRENIPSTSPSKQLKQTFPVSGFGISVGASYNFGK